jgi:hypothetical protein
MIADVEGALMPLRDVCFGSKAEKLALSICCPLYP